MKNLIVFGMIGLFGLSLVGADQSGTTSVRLIKPLAVHKDKDLMFGDFIMNYDPTQGATAIEMEATNNNGADYFKTSNNGVVTLYNGTSKKSTPQTARFTITGEPNLTCLVKTPVDITLANEAGQGNLHLQAKGVGSWEWTYDPLADGTFTIQLWDGYTAGEQTVDLNGAGMAKFYVGGVLSLPAGSASGLYAGTFGVTVTYN